VGRRRAQGDAQMLNDQARRPWNWILLAFVLLLTPVSAQNARNDIELYKWTGQGWDRIEGSGVRVSVGPNGMPWIVKANGTILRSTRDGWRQLPGAAIDIGVGGDGSAWIIGTDNFVYRWTGRTWERVEGAGVAISVDEDGDPWIVGLSGQISRWDGDRFVSVPGNARDIGAESSVWIVGRDGALQEMQSNGRFSASRGTGVHISAGANGAAWAVNDLGEIYRAVPGGFQRMPGAATDIGSNFRGETYIVGIPVNGPAEERRATPRRR
jgi:hypothetical protein